MNSILKNKTLILILACLLSRLPMLLSRNSFLDGDECIVGLMAKHFQEGKEFPIFFYGQSYGFSFFEIIPISILYSILGLSVLSIKIAMLCLWTFGIIMFHKALEQIGQGKNQLVPILVTLVLIFMPSFAIWSMKARGGYLTAFFLSSCILYLLFRKQWKNSISIYFLSGLLLYTLYQSQPLWLVGLLPIVTYIAFRERNIKYVIYLAMGIGAGVILFYILKANLSDFWSPSVLSWSNLNLDTLLTIPKTIYYNMTGSYHYSEIIEPILMTKILAMTFTIMIFVVLLYGLVSFIKRKPKRPLFFVSCISVIFTIGYLVFINSYTYRYLLPLSGYTLLMLYLCIIDLDNKKTIISLLCLMVVSGGYSMYHFKNYKYNDIDSKLSLVKTLINKEVDYVYCEGGLLQWEIMFHSKEKVIARYRSNVDRYPKYIEQVDDALEQSKYKIALVGYYNKELVQNTYQFVSVGNSFFIFENPTKDILVKRGFNLNKIDNSK